MKGEVDSIVVKLHLQIQSWNNKDDYWAHVPGQGGGQEGKGIAWQGFEGAGGEVRPGVGSGAGHQEGGARTLA